MLPKGKHEQVGVGGGQASPKSSAWILLVAPDAPLLCLTCSVAKLEV